MKKTALLKYGLAMVAMGAIVSALNGLRPRVSPTRNEPGAPPVRRHDAGSAGRLRPRLRPEVRTATKGDRIALVTPAGALLPLNEVGARVALLLDGGHSLADIARVVAGEYDVTEEAALRDIDAFVGKMEKEGLLAPGPAGP